MVSKIDELIKYLIRVFNGTELTSESKKEQEKYGDYTKEDEIVRSQDFFIFTKDLDKILEPWFGGFKNDEELNKTLKFKLGALKKLSFSKGKEGFSLLKSESSHSNLILSNKSHNNYSHLIHSHLIEVFEERIGIKKVKENKKITIRDKKVYDLVKALNLKIDFLRDDCSAEEFVEVLVGQSDKNIHLNIKNRSFHYLLSKLKDYFYNFSITSVANTNKIFGETGTLLNSKNLAASKSYSPKHMDAIDEVFKNFK
ncbi:MAG: hypothetical protein P8O98_08200 [Flavobacteriaceae bacterium]|nr:hypothetical protein [Flavobacteriaceae bacterium]